MLCRYADKVNDNRQARRNLGREKKERRRKQNYKNKKEWRNRLKHKDALDEGTVSKTTPQMHSPNQADISLLPEELVEEGNTATEARNYRTSQQDNALDGCRDGSSGKNQSLEIAVDKFRNAIDNPAEHRCAICGRLMYAISLIKVLLKPEQVQLLNTNG